MKKKFLATVLGLTLALASTTAAFASTTISPDSNGDPNSSEAEMTVTYEVEPTYTVTIPAEVVMGNTVTLSAEDVRIAEGSKVNVSIVSTGQGDYLLILYDGDPSGSAETLEYTVTDGNSTTYALYDTVLSVSPDAGEGSVDLTFALVDGEVPTYSGTYSATLTFKIAIEGD